MRGGHSTEWIPGPADDRMCAQVPRGLSDPRPRRPGPGPAAGYAALAGEVERLSGRRDHQRVERVRLGDRVRGIQDHRAEHPVIAGREGLAEEGPEETPEKIAPASV